jgi:hypothetical protein
MLKEAGANPTNTCFLKKILVDKGLTPTSLQKWPGVEDKCTFERVVDCFEKCISMQESFALNYGFVNIAHRENTLLVDTEDVFLEFRVMMHQLMSVSMSGLKDVGSFRHAVVKTLAGEADIVIDLISVYEHGGKEEEEVPLVNFW